MQKAKVISYLALLLACGGVLAAHWLIVRQVPSTEAEHHARAARHPTRATPAALNGWQRRGGQWSADGALRGDGHGRLLMGTSRWGNYVFRVRLEDGARAGVVFNYRDEQNCHVATFDCATRRATLQVLEDGAERTLDQQPFAATPPFDVTVETRDGHLRVAVEGRRLLEGWDRHLRRGRVGLQVFGNACVFDDVDITHTPPPDPAVAVNPVFAGERTMTAWAGEINEWYAGPSRREKTPTHWHRAQFAGDLSMTAQIRKRPDDAALLLAVLAEDEPTDPANEDAYVLSMRISSTAPAGGPGEALSPSGDRRIDLQLTRREQVVSRTSFDHPSYPRSFTLRRAGRFIVGCVDNQPEIVFRDDSILPHTRLAYAASENLELQPRDLTIHNDHVFDDTFRRSPTAWRVGAGWWETTPRWECDMRWHFFAGRSWTDRHLPQAGEHLRPAVLWSRRLFEEDVTVEAFAGPMMVRELDRNYGYLRDFNITLSADGTDCSSGYTCSLGAEDNAGAAIYRAGRRVTFDADARLMRHKRIHLQWYYLRAQRKGNRIRFQAWRCPAVNRDWQKLTELTWTDDKPLSGRQVALWTYGSGMVLSRVRISGPGGLQFEPLARPAPIHVGTYYDHLPDQR